MSILVIGGTGLLGSHVVQGLALDANVLGHLPRCFHTFVNETVAAWERDGPREHVAVGKENGCVV